MKIRVISDAHFEFITDKEMPEFVAALPNDCDVLVLAGDITTYSNQVVVIGEFCKKYKHVVRVYGNHEFYGTSRGDVHNKTRKLQGRHSNLHVLNDSHTVIDGQRFIGCTLWFEDTPQNAMSYRLMNDCRRIQGFSKWVWEVSRNSAKYLRDNVQEGDVVVTHHAPSERSISENYRNNRDWAVNGLYFYPMDDVLEGKRPRLWLHGHMHDAADYTVDGGCRVYSNPMGYHSYQTSWEIYAQACQRGEGLIELG